MKRFYFIFADSQKCRATKNIWRNSVNRYRLNIQAYLAIIKSNSIALWIQVNLCQKLLFLHQLTHNMTTDCSLNYKFITWKFQAQNMGRTCCVQKSILTFRTIYVHNMFSSCSEKIRASDKDLPAHHIYTILKYNGM